LSRLWWRCRRNCSSTHKFRPACGFLTKDKAKNGRNRKGEFLFVDARRLGRMEGRVFRVFDDDDIGKSATPYTPGGEMVNPSRPTLTCRASAAR